MIRHCIFALLAIATAQPVLTATLRVPQDHKTIQAAIDASNPGNTITMPAAGFLKAFASSRTSSCGANPIITGKVCFYLCEWATGSDRCHYPDGYSYEAGYKVSVNA